VLPGRGGPGIPPPPASVIEIKIKKKRNKLNKILTPKIRVISKNVLLIS
jgi:hypothetical protein